MIEQLNAKALGGDKGKARIDPLVRVLSKTGDEHTIDIGPGHRGTIKSLSDIGHRRHHGKHHHHIVKTWHVVAVGALLATVLWSMVILLRMDARKCTMDDATINTCTRRLLFFSDIEKFPSTDKQLDAYCSSKIESLKCLRRYVHSCIEVSRSQGKFIRRFVRSYQRQLDKTCLRRNERQKFISYSSCLSEAELIQNATRCHERYQDQLLYIAQYVPDEEKIPSACCSLHERHGCLTTNVSVQCEAGVRSFVDDQIEGPFKSLVKTICEPDYLSARACRRSIEPALWRRLFEQPEKLRSMLEQARLEFIANNTEYVHVDSETLSSASDLTTSATGPNTRGKPNPELKKLVQLKFQESFLAMIFIMRKANE